VGTQDSNVVSPGGVTRGVDGPDGERDVTQTRAPTTPTGVASTRAGRAWVKVLPALLVLAVILVFIFQNSQSAKVSFITASGRLPLAIALLAAAALGALFVLALGSIRILQLRRTIHRSARRSQVHQPQTGAL
jgi:putative membrane protein